MIQKAETVRLWFRLRNAQYIRRVHEWSLRKSRTWEWKILRFIDSHNLNGLMLTNNPAKAACISATGEILIETDNDKRVPVVLKDGR